MCLNHRFALFPAFWIYRLLEFLQMKYALLNFLGAPLVPVLGADVAACTASNVHCCLVCISAVRALPDKFLVHIFFDFDFTGVAAFLTEVALCIEFGIHYVVINKLHNFQNCWNIVLHIRNFYI